MDSPGNPVPEASAASVPRQDSAPEPAAEAADSVDDFHYQGHPDETALTPTSTIASGGSGGELPPAGDGGEEGGDDEEEQMAKMSFLEHLEELRQRIIRALLGVAVGFGLCFWLSIDILEHMGRPLFAVLTKMGQKPVFRFGAPGDPFAVALQIAIYAGLFLASPYVMYQVWAFIAPGLYRREKKYAVPFVLVSSTLFILGGAFAYFIAFPYALEFLMNFGGALFEPIINARDYLELFLAVVLGMALIFEAPILILLLALLRIVTPGFLLRNFRYAVLVITVVAAVLTPTTDAVTLALFAIPMIALYLLGAAFAWLVTWRRDRAEREPA
jgi:sec-independent protein translocase protein TatC